MKNLTTDQVSCYYDIFINIKDNNETTFSFFSMGSPCRAPLGEPVVKTFADMHRDIRTCYNNLVKLGISESSTLGLNIGNSYYFFVCDFASILLGARTILHSKNDPPELLTLRLEKFRITHLISEKPVPGIEDKCKVIELHELFAEDAPPVEIPKRPWGNRDVSIVFSSGTSGIPKGLGVSERGSIETGKHFFQWMGFDQRDKFLVYLPLASYQQRFLMWSCMIKNVHIIHVEDKHLFKALKVFKPTILLAPPNFFFNLYRMDTGTRLKHVIRKLLPRQRHNSLSRAIAARYAYRPLYETLGGHTRYLVTGMAPIDFKILEHFKHAGLDIYQIYGQTEIGMIACNKIAANRLGTVGKPIIPLHLDEEDNEIITHSDFPTINSYYLEDNQPKPLGKRIPTGDIGALDSDGYLTIKGRKNETLILKSGIKINPALIESKIKAKLGQIEEVLIFKPGNETGETRETGEAWKADLFVVLLLKSPHPDLEKVKEELANEQEIRQSSERVGIFTYLVKKEDRPVMYTENNKLSRVRTIALLKKNFQELERIN